MYDSKFLNLHSIQLYSGLDKSEAGGGAIGVNPSTSKRRDKLYIIAEIVELARDGILKTHVMYRANLSYTQTKDYLKFMLKNKLIEKILINDKDIYKTTKKGIDFLQQYRDITELIRTHDENTTTIPPEHLLTKK